MSKRLGGIKGCKYKTSSWHLNGFPMEITLGQQYNVGEKPTVILHTCINRHAGTPEKQRKQKHCSTSLYMVVIIYCYIPVGYKDKATTWCVNGFPDGSNLGSTVGVVVIISGKSPPLYCTLTTLISM